MGLAAFSRDGDVNMNERMDTRRGGTQKRVVNGLSDTIDTVSLV